MRRQRGFISPGMAISLVVSAVAIYVALTVVVPAITQGFAAVSQALQFPNQ